MSIFKPKNSSYWYFDLTDASGTRVKRSTGRKVEAEAQAINDAEERRFSDIKRLGDGGAHTFAEAAARWLKETEKKTVDKDRYQLKWLGEQIGEDARLSSITIEGINTLRELCAVDENGEPRTKTTINLYMACLRSVLRKAQSEWGWLTVVPKVPMYGKGKKAKKKTKFFLAPTEFEALRQELPEHLALAAEFAVEHGLRMRSQLKGLTWKRIDIKRRHAWVPSEGDDGGAGQKSGTAFGFTLSPGAIDVLKRCKELNPTGTHPFMYPDAAISPMTDKDIERICRALNKTGERVTILTLRAHLRAEFGVRGNSERVTRIWQRVCKPSASRAGIKHGVVVKLPKPAPKPAVVWRVYDDANTKAFKAAVIRAGLDPKLVHWHTFRHTFASWAVQNGVSLQELMVMGDWADMDSVLVYAHLNEGNLAHAASKVSEFRLTHKAA